MMPEMILVELGLLAPPGALCAMMGRYRFLIFSLGPTINATQGDTQNALRAHSYHSQSILRKHSENTQKTIREQSEKTKRTQREHSEKIHRTQRE